MHNFSDQKVRQMTQRTTKLGVEILPAGVRCDLGRQTRQKPLESLRSVALQEEEVLELVYDPLDDLALGRRPQQIRLRPCSWGIVLRSRRHQSAMLPKPAPLPVH